MKTTILLVTALCVLGVGCKKKVVATTGGTPQVAAPVAPPEPPKPEPAAEKPAADFRAQQKNLAEQIEKQKKALAEKQARAPGRSYGVAVVSNWWDPTRANTYGSWRGPRRSAKSCSPG